MVLGHFSADHIPFLERCAIVAAAGFTGLSVRFEEMRDLIAAEGLRSVMEVLARHNLAADHVELVMLPGPADAGERAAYHDAFLKVAGSVGARAVHAVPLDVTAPLDQVVATFGELADRAADRDLLCALEFVPQLTATPDLASAWEVCRRVDRPNAGLVMDSFHFFRCGAPWTLLETLPPGSIFTVQLNDGWLPARTEDFKWEAGCGRLPPGEGDFDLPRFLRAVDRARTPGPIAIEVMSDAMDALDPTVSVTAMAKAGRKSLAGSLGPA